MSKTTLVHLVDPPYQFLIVSDTCAEFYLILNIFLLVKWIFLSWQIFIIKLEISRNIRKLVVVANNIYQIL